MNHDHWAIWDCFWLFPLHFSNIISNCLAILSSYLFNIWTHELLILAAISVTTSLGCSHFVVMLDNEKSEETDLQFLSKMPVSSSLKSFLRALSPLPSLILTKPLMKNENCCDGKKYFYCHNLDTTYSIVLCCKPPDVHCYCYCHPSKKHRGKQDFDTGGALWGAALR